MGPKEKKQIESRIKELLRAVNHEWVTPEQKGICRAEIERLRKILDQERKR